MASDSNDSQAKSLVQKYLLDPIDEDDEPDVDGLAHQLDVILTESSNYILVRKVFELMSDKISSLEDNVGAELMGKTVDPMLQLYASVPEGRGMLDAIYAAMITGNVSDFERAQGDRILKAKAISEKEYIAQVEGNLLVYPVRNQGLLRDCYSAFTAELAKGKVRVEFTSVRIWQCDMFKKDTATFGSYTELMKPREFDTDQLVGVRLYDVNEDEVIPVPAIALIDFANQSKNKTISLATTAFLTGLTVGAGGLGGGAAAEALNPAYAADALTGAELTGSALWKARAIYLGAKALLWADRIAVILPALSSIVDDNRDWISSKVPGGATLLDAFDKINTMAGYYGWARLGFDSLRFLKGKVSAAFKERKAGGIPSSLSASERETITQLDQQMENVLISLQQSEDEAMANAVDYVNKHPDKTNVEGGLRRAEVGGGHEIREVEGADPRSPQGVGCKLFSEEGELLKDCPIGWGDRAGESAAEAASRKSARAVAQETKEAARAEIKQSLDEVRAQKRQNSIDRQKIQDRINNAERRRAQLLAEDKTLTGEAKAAARAEQRKITVELHGDEGETTHGLLEDQKAEGMTKNQLEELERNLESSLRLERPALTGESQAAIEQMAPKARGRYLEPPEFKVEIEGAVHFGHKPGFEHRRLALEAQRRGMTQAQFNAWVNKHATEFFWVESEARNLSHAGEEPGIEYEKGRYDGFKS